MPCMRTLRVLRPSGYLIARNPNRWHPLDQFTSPLLIQLLLGQPGYLCSPSWIGRPRSKVKPLVGLREALRPRYQHLLAHRPQ